MRKGFSKNVPRVILYNQIWQRRDQRLQTLQHHKARNTTMIWSWFKSFEVGLSHFRLFFVSLTKSKKVTIDYYSSIALIWTDIRRHSFKSVSKLWLVQHIGSTHPETLGFYIRCLLTENEGFGRNQGLWWLDGQKRGTQSLWVTDPGWRGCRHPDEPWISMRK